MISQIKLYLYGAGALLLIALGFYLHHSGYTEGVTEIQSQWDADKAARQMEYSKQLLEQADKVRQGEIQHEKDLQTIASAVSAASNVRVHFPRTACPLPSTPQTRTDTNRATGVVQPTVESEFRIFQLSVGKIIERCDKLNADAIESNRVTQ